MKKYHWIVLPEENKISLMSLVHNRFDGMYSKRALKQMIDLGAAEVNGKVERFGSKKLKGNDTISFYLKEEKVEFQFNPNSILYEDSDVLVYNKPPGLICNEGIRDFFSGYIDELYLVHRLDRYTSGCLLFTKTKTAKEKVDDLFKKRKIEKTYLAIVEGTPRNKRGLIKNKLGIIGSYSGQKIWGEDPLGKSAETYYEIIKEGKELSLILVKPITGRTHQIRVHLNGLGCPIIGDSQYCKKFKSPYRPIHYLLHAHKLSFNEIEVEAPFHSFLFNKYYNFV